MNSTEYKDLLEKHGGVGFEKQFSLAEVIGDRSWSVDMEQGILSFDEEFAFPIQILGTYSFSSSTWLWAWANEGSNIPEDLLRISKQLRQYGTDNLLDFWVTDKSEANEMDMHAIGMIASSMYKSSAYYCGNFGDGVILVTLDSKEVDNLAVDERTRIPSAFSQLISMFEMDHKTALINYLKAKGYTISEDPQGLIGTRGEDSFRATFDGLNRMTNLTTEISNNK